MKKFVVIYRAPTSAFDAMKDATPEDMQAGMQDWMAWAARCGDSLVDMGSPLGSGQTLTKSGSAPNDGVAGYSILQAEDMDGAKGLLDGHPHLNWAPGCEIDVHECLSMEV